MTFATLKGGENFLDRTLGKGICSDNWKNRRNLHICPFVPSFLPCVGDKIGISMYLLFENGNRFDINGCVLRHRAKGNLILLTQGLLIMGTVLCVE